MASEMHRLDSVPLVVGSWPGRPSAGNQFVPIFCDGLEKLGVVVVDVADPRNLERKVDILHIHWPEKVFWGQSRPWVKIYRALSTMMALGLLKARGTRIVWMVHNLQPHDMRGWRKFAWPVIVRVVARLASGYLTLSPSTIGIVRDAISGLDGKPAAAVLHPAYREDHDVRKTERAPAERTFLFAGLLRPYKGVEDLIAAFRDTKCKDWRLVIAGKPKDPRYLAKLMTLSDGDERISIVPRFIPPAEFDDLLRKADAMVLPYKNYLHSGSILKTLSHGLPVITPSHPFADEVAMAAGKTWVYRYDGPLSGDILERWDAPCGLPDLSSMHPSLLAKVALRLYRDILSNPR